MRECDAGEKVGGEGQVTAEQLREVGTGSQVMGTAGGRQDWGAGEKNEGREEVRPGQSDGEG